MFKNDFWELDIHKNPLLFFLGIQLGYIFSFPCILVQLMQCELDSYVSLPGLLH